MNGRSLHHPVALLSWLETTLRRLHYDRHRVGRHDLPWAERTSPPEVLSLEELGE